MKIENIDVSDFSYISSYIDHNTEYHGWRACKIIALDIIALILHDRYVLFGNETETRYISYVVDVYIDYLWTVYIDMDLLHFNNFEVIAVCDNNDARIHVKNDKWFDNIDNLKEKTSCFITEMGAMYKAVWFIIRELNHLYFDGPKANCKVLSEEYVADFKE